MAGYGYTYQEANEFGFYEWTLIATRQATKAEATNSIGCDFYEDCPCCNCGEAIALIQTYARPRWSKSAKAMVEDIDIVWRCASHG